MEAKEQENKMQNIIQRNFFRLLRSGAFNENEAVEPMSPFKWRRLFQMAEAQHVVPVFVSGIEKHADDHMLNLPGDLKSILQQKGKEEEEQKQTITDEDIRLSNHILNKRLKRIISQELESEDTSIESIDLLEILIFNVSRMLNRGLSLDGIIRLGQYLRQRGDKVDFVKIESWLKALKLERMAQLQGSILMAAFGFEQDELPFVQEMEKEVMPLITRAVSDMAKDSAEEWHFHQTQSGFVQNNSRVLRRNVGRSMKFYPYAPWETTSSFFTNLGRSLSEIEE